MTPQTDVTRLLGEERTSPDRREIGTLQFVDFILIALYVTTFILLAVQVRRTSMRLSALVCAAIAITGVLDVLEDRAILLAIGWWSNAQPQNVALFGFAKWTMLYVSTVLLGLALLRAQQSWRRFTAIPGLILSAVGIVGVGAVVTGQYATVARLLGALGIGVIGAAIVTGR
jgi:hypothetical protein